MLPSRSFPDLSALHIGSDGRVHFPAEEKKARQSKRRLRAQREVYMWDKERHWLRKHGKHSCLDFLDEERDQLKRVFHQLHDKDGKVNVDHLLESLVSLGIIENEEHLHKALPHVDLTDAKGLTFDAFAQLVLKCGSGLGGAFRTLMEGTLVEQDATQDESDHDAGTDLKNVIAEYRRTKILSAMMGEDVRSPHCGEARVGTDPADMQRAARAAHILKNYQALCVARGDIETSPGKSAFTSVTLSSAFNNILREHHLVPTTVPMSDVPWTPRTVLAKVQSQRWKRQRAAAILAAEGAASRAQSAPAGDGHATLGRTEPFAIAQVTAV